MGPLSSCSSSTVYSASSSTNWAEVAKVRFSIGKIIHNNQHRGCGILIGIDRMIVPFHTVSGSCPSDLEIHFQNDAYCYSFRVEEFLLFDRKLDFCILQLKEKMGVWPGNFISFPQISYDLHQGDYALASFTGEFPSVQIVESRKSCAKSHLYSIYETSQGSSGSGLFDDKGRLFAMHLSRSTGLCGIDSNVRKAIYLHEMISSSEKAWSILNIPPCTPICPSISNPRCLPPSSNHNICFADEGRPVIKGKIGDLFYWEHRPKNSAGGGPRGLTIAPGNRSKITYVFRENPHDYREYNKDQSRLYKNAAEALIASSTIGLPNSFSFLAFNQLFNADFLEQETFEP